MKLLKFEQLIQPLLTEDKRYLSHKCKSLVSPGENYGSVILDVEVELDDRAGNCKHFVHCVAKACPPRGFTWILFNTPITFKKEIGLYTEIVPKLISFSKKYGLVVNYYAKLYGARISSEEYSEEIDETACLLLENLKYVGYNILDRFIGFDYGCTKAIIKNLAVFHAVPIAYKLKYPKIFATFAPILRKGINSVFSEENVYHACNEYKEFIKDKHQYLFSRVIEGYRNILNYAKPEENTNELFRTISHNDMWLNNIMMESENGNIFKTKFVDFQLVEFSSLVNDLIFFLYTSVQIDVLQEHYDYFIKLYYNVFINTLEKLKCNVKDYTFDAFLTEISYVARNYQFCHILCMLVPIYTLKSKAKELTQFSIDDFKPHKENLHDNFVHRLHFVIEDFAKRNWI